MPGLDDLLLAAQVSLVAGVVLTIVGLIMGLMGL